MIRLFETWEIKSVEQSDTICDANSLDAGWRGVVVEVQNADEELQGTLVYYPGVSWKELKKSVGTVSAGLLMPKELVELMDQTPVVGL